MPATILYLTATNGAPSRPDRIVVVRGSIAPVVARPAIPAALPPVRTTVATPTPDALAASVRRTYPRLVDVEVRCEPDRCTLTGTIFPPATDDDRDRQQDMLLGGLEALFAAEGYRMAAPLQMDEVGDGEFRLRATLPPPGVGHAR